MKEYPLTLKKNSTFTCYCNIKCRCLFCYFGVIWSPSVWFVFLELLGCFDSVHSANCETLTVSVSQTCSASSPCVKQLWHFCFFHKVLIASFHSRSARHMCRLSSAPCITFIEIPLWEIELWFSTAVAQESLDTDSPLSLVRLPLSPGWSWSGEIVRVCDHLGWVFSSCVCVCFKAL